MWIFNLIISSRDICGARGFYLPVGRGVGRAGCTGAGSTLAWAGALQARPVPEIILLPPAAFAPTEG